MLEFIVRSHGRSFILPLERSREVKKDKPLVRLAWEYGKGWHNPLGSATPSKKVCEMCGAPAESERELIAHKLKIHPEVFGEEAVRKRERGDRKVDGENRDKGFSERAVQRRLLPG
jgi:hypothetical protein